MKRIFSSQLRVNMVSGMITTILNIAAMAVGYPIYLHFLGYEKYGIWLVLAVVLTFAQLGNLGINPAVTKLIAEEHGRNNIRAIQSYLSTALVIVSLSGMAALAAVLMFRVQIADLLRLSDEDTRLAVALLPYIGGLSVYTFVANLYNSALSGLGRMDLANYIQSGGRLLTVAVASVLMYLGRGIESMIIASACSYLFIHLTSIVCLKNQSAPCVFRFSDLDVRYGRRLLSFGGAVFGCSLISMLLNPFNKIMLSMYADVSIVPVYEIAYNGSMQVRALMESALRALMPEISRMGVSTATATRKRIVRLSRRATKLLVLFGVPLYGVMAVLSPFMFRMWLRSDNNEKLPAVFGMMLIGTFLSLVCVPAYYTLMGLGRVRCCLFSQILQGGVNATAVGIIILLTKRLSIYSAAAALALAMGATSFYLLVQNRRLLRQVESSSPGPSACTDTQSAAVSYNGINSR